MKKSTFLTLGTAVALLAGASAAQAAIADPAAVTPLDTFTFDIVGYNSTSSIGYVLGSVETATFGLTTTYTGAGVDGQNITVTSAESVSGTKTTDTITVSTPTSFILEATDNGTTINGVEFNIGVGGNTLDYALPITGATATGNILYSTSTSYTLSPITSLSNNSESLAATEAISVNGGTVSSLAIHSFTYSITYNTLPVPEPSTYAAAVIGALALGTVLLRRNRRLVGR